MKTATPNAQVEQLNHDIQINVLFKKMQKDDKKEILMFHILSDETKYAADLLKLTGKMTILTVTAEGEQYEPIQAQFMNLQRDSKKTVLKFNVETEDEARVNAIYPAAGTNIDLLIQPQQLTIDDVPSDSGLKYEVGLDGTVNIEEDPFEDVENLEMFDESEYEVHEGEEDE